MAMNSLACLTCVFITNISEFERVLKLFEEEQMKMSDTESNIR